MWEWEFRRLKKVEAASEFTIHKPSDIALVPFQLLDVASEVRVPDAAAVSLWNTLPSPELTSPSIDH